MDKQEDNGNSANEAGSSHTGLWVGISIAMTPVLYVLSIGPVLAYTNHNYVFPPEPILKFYMPVLWLHANTPLQGPLEAYARLWGWN